MKETIEISRTAHYYLQIPTQPVKSILYVIHGYAQLAKDFLKEFEKLKDSPILVVAPEGLSKFYNKERQAVANWMTAHEREDEIIDYINYLNKLENKISSQYGQLPKRVLGFSQGVSTALRWIPASNTYTEKVHLCSGSIPPELKKTAFKHLSTSHFNYYYGTNDGLLRRNKAMEQIEFLNKLVANCESFEFEGRHEIPEKCFAKLLLDE